MKLALFTLTIMLAIYASQQADGTQLQDPTGSLVQEPDANRVASILVPGLLQDEQDLADEDAEDTFVPVARRRQGPVATTPAGAARKPVCPGGCARAVKNYTRRELSKLEEKIQFGGSECAEGAICSFKDMKAHIDGEIAKFNGKIAEVNGTIAKHKSDPPAAVPVYVWILISFIGVTTLLVLTPLVIYLYTTRIPTRADVSHSGTYQEVFSRVEKNGSPASSSNRQPAGQPLAASGRQSTSAGIINQFKNSVQPSRPKAESPANLSDAFGISLNSDVERTPQAKPNKNPAESSQRKRK